MDENPFAEPDDDDRTVVRPRPATLPAPARPSGGDESAPPLASLALPGTSPILSAAAPTLSLLVGLGNLLSPPDPAALRDRAVLEIQRYERILRDRSVPIETLRMGHYALCASLDDLVQNTPWGSSGPWADASLVSTFHGEVRSGERFFDLLGRLRASPDRYLPVIELMYICMSLGMQGRYRLSPRGPAEHDRVREDTYLVILRQRGAAEKSLSPQWRGATAPYRPLRSEVPFWAAGLAAACLVGAAYAWSILNLNQMSDNLFEAALSLPPSGMPSIERAEPPRPLPPLPSPTDPRKQLASTLGPDIAAGSVVVAGTGTAPILRLQSAGMFASGRADLAASVRPLLARIAAAAKPLGGPMEVIGYTDDQPIHTLAFPSNYQLSLARAHAAASVLAETIGPDRLTVDGRADADPLASNATAAGRQQNRRIEIVVTPARAQP